MIEDRVTLELKGTIHLDLLATAIAGLNGLLKTLTTELSGKTEVTWVIEDLNVGSAMVTVAGQATDPQAVDRVVRAYEAVGNAIQQDEQIPYSDAVRQQAKKITGILNGKVSEVYFRTREKTFVKSTPITGTTPTQSTSQLISYGAVEGAVQTVTNRNALRFTLYDSLYDRAVQCYLAPGQDELMREFWEKRVIVQGMITRDNTTGRPVEIRQISNIFPVIPGDYKQGRGALAPHNEPPEETIRRIRNA